MTRSTPIRLLKLVATPTTDPVGVALIVVFIHQRWRRFSGSFCTAGAYLLKSQRSTVFDREMCWYMRDTVRRIVPAKGIFAN